MSLSKIDAVCKKCNLKAMPKKSYLGFQEFVCPSCGGEIAYPLTSNYRAFYWGLIIMSVIIWIFIFPHLKHKIDPMRTVFSAVIGFVIFASVLVRDWNIRKAMGGRGQPEKK